MGSGKRRRRTGCGGKRIVGQVGELPYKSGMGSILALQQAWV